MTPDAVSEPGGWQDVRQMGRCRAIDARNTLEQLTSALESHLGTDLQGLYLFGSLAAGGFYPGTTST
jgi:hypothetical protein